MSENQIELIKTILWCICIFLFFKFVIASYQVSGPSMLPTMEDKQRILVNLHAERLGTLERGDIIVFESPNDGLHLIKRLIGVEGDHIMIERGEVYVNDVLLDETYINEPFGTNGEWTIPEDHYFVMGDNRNRSNDSRSFDSIDHELLRGEVLVSFWPFSLLGGPGHVDLDSVIDAE